MRSGLVWSKTWRSSGWTTWVMEESESTVPAALTMSAFSLSMVPAPRKSSR